MLMSSHRNQTCRTNVTIINYVLLVMNRLTPLVIRLPVGLQNSKLWYPDCATPYGFSQCDEEKKWEKKKLAL